MSSIELNRNLAGDFIGFTFNDIHSSELGLIRVSDGSKYNFDLLPSFVDRTTQAQGKDGMYYQGSDDTQKIIKVSVAFNKVTEEDLDKISLLFGDKKIHELWFDETPYKVYWAKINTPPQFSVICFDEEEVTEEGLLSIKRVYKGQGTLEFICHVPYAQARAPFEDISLSGERFALSYFSGKEIGFDGVFHNHFLAGNNNDVAVFDAASGEFDEAAEYYIKTINGFGYTLVEEPIAEDFENYYIKRTENITSEDIPTVSIGSNYIEQQYIGNIGSFFKETEQPLTVSYNYNEWIKASKLLKSNDLISEGSVKQVYNPGHLPANLKIKINGINSDSNYIINGFVLSLIDANPNPSKVIKSLTINNFALNSGDVGVVIDTKIHLIYGVDSNGQQTGNVYDRYHIAGDFFEIPVGITKSSNYFITTTAIDTGTINFDIEYMFYYK